jgi:hypothetical protein
MRWGVEVVTELKAIQLAPLSREYSYRVIALPPSEVGALKLADKKPFPGVREVKVGTPGVVSGVTVSDAVLELLSPTVA